MWTDSDIRYMRRCLELAQLGQASVAPNPMVGAVLVHEGRIIGEGWHRQYGQAHAEVNCFEHVAEADRQLLREATMYVSLEPCAHYGKTPPCALRIIAEGVPRVVIANRDPFARVDGRGIALLEAAGIEVRSGCLAAEGEWLNRRFFTAHRQQRPYVILKWAQSANACLAPSDRSRFALSDAVSQRLSHRWRSEEAAIMVGFRTALADNPQLTNRYWPGTPPLRIVVDRDLSLPATHHLLDASVPTWILNRSDNREVGNNRFLALDFSGDWIAALLHALYAAGRHSLIVEGGNALLNDFITRSCWDEARIFHTPVTLTGGIPAPALAAAAGSFSWPLQRDRLELVLKQAPENGLSMDRL